jgi:hypothetical protein
LAENVHAMPASIEWTDEPWNPVTGCVKVNPGCKHCYAETFAERFRGTVMPHCREHPFFDGFDPRLRPERLDQQSRTLATLRDRLLPKLLCGELRVAEFSV